MSIELSPNFIEKWRNATSRDVYRASVLQGPGNEPLQRLEIAIDELFVVGVRSA